MVEPKYYEKIRTAQAKPPGETDLATFDFNVLKGGGGLGATLAQSRLLHRILRRFWPVGRIGRLGWVVRHSDVAEMRERWEDFNVPYGLEMRDLTGGEDFALGLQDGPAYRRQLAFMRSVIRADDLPRLVAPNARRLSKAVVAYSGGEIDGVEDLLVRVAVETCADYYGLAVDDPVAFAQWLMSVSTLLFADYLGSDTVRQLALAGAARIRRVLDAAIRRAHDIAVWRQSPPAAGSPQRAAFDEASRWYDDTLVGRFVALQLAGQDGPCDGEIRAMLLGMAVGYVPTGGGAGGNVLEVLLRRPEWLAKAQEAARTNQDDRLTRILMEAMRFSPPINPGVPRYVARSTRLGGATIPEGVMLIAASASAMFDPRVVSHPERFDPDRDTRHDLQFGGHFIHYCIGEQLTRVLLLEIFKPLLVQKGLQRADGKKGQLEKVGPFPQHLGLTFLPSAGQRAQSMVTICVPVTEATPVSELNKLIDALGNPASAAIQKALDLTGLVHFAHVSAIDGERGSAGRTISPAYLVVELSVDGPANPAIQAFVEACGEPLLKLFILATSARTADDLRRLLRENVRTLVAGRVLSGRDTASGLNFPGTPELPVTQIDRDARVAAEARRYLDAHLKAHLATGSRASAAMEWVRERIKAGDFRPDLVRPLSVSLAASRRADRPFSQALGSLFSDWSFTGKIVGLFGAALLIHYVLTHGLYTSNRAGLAIAITLRAAVSVAAAVAAVWIIATLWRWLRAAVSDARPKSTSTPVAEHGRELLVSVFLVATLHFAVFQNDIGFADWDMAAFGERLVLVAATAWDLLTSLIIGGLVFVAVVAALVGALILLLRRSETTASLEDFDPSLGEVNELLKRENAAGYAQNHIIAVTPLKTNPRWLRRMTLGLSFWVIEKLVQHRFRPGFVLDIGTIHFARWFRLPGTDKLVFLSNYDGSWESYLEDFITKAHLGQTAVWSNGVGFPKTSFLMFDGAEDGARFKRWVRRQQVPTRFWYSRFPKLTTNQIRTNAMICEGLAKAGPDSDCQAWVDLFGSQPRPNTVLQYDEIQGLVFNGMGKLPAAELIPVRLPEDRSKWQGWLKSLIGVDQHSTVSAAPRLVESIAAGGLLAFGENTPTDVSAAIAFSSDGLAHMGLGELDYRLGGDPDGSTLKTFPTGFLDGMSTDARARMFGDAGDSSPKHWTWAREDGRPHAVFIVYAKDSETLTVVGERLKREMREQYGFDLLDSIRMTDLPEKGSDMQELFGFNDGVSQPVMRGTKRYHEGIHEMHVVEPGEFILGYGDNRGDTPPSPVVGPEYDRGLLPSLTSDLPGRFPAFERSRSHAPRDLGRNGSYLVIRQLEQNATGFKAHTAAQASAVQQRFPGSPVTADWIAAKMVGRWRNGSSLVRNPFAQGDAADNDFLYGVEDPQGIRCPYGAHTRRAFPRDSLSPDDTTQLSISNRHRLLRRGRAYGSEDGKRADGLLFMCLNTDIERQFEFVQQTWVASPNFHGLAGEPDPVIASRTGAAPSSNFTIPTPSGPITLLGIESFVTVRNGGYFFLPSRSAILFLATFSATDGP